MISLIDCVSTPTVNDMIWNGGGNTSISNYNSTNNYVTSSPGFYFGNSFGRATASFVNVLLGTATLNAIVYSDSDCLLKYSNFYKNKVNDDTQWFLCFKVGTSSVDHCVFANNTAKTFEYTQLSVSYCSFDQNSFSSIPSSIPYKGSYSFVVNTECHMLKQDNCNKKYSCVSKYFNMNYLLSSFSIFILFL
ncbi:hypothetical protein TVAG_171250 [Trichomonas vaginalis G3]|uniref:Uncharacterized protein n=1 Tax=Trichomonas vaginalis (strain ATCC PRA-98 / G3) TaxID=412133 RepID=A2FYX5_TRIV3|nr:hypothetical protein TVAGG3_0240420 [Trichomonas vaginalis G3]EAX89896.1 hypothetical protein TVAG_171250 [Trichomonas vaginalis G3]KAI5553288.1 hypothetical protein TVAGG3_0240420 [Trichomonas vaginalis G3]|eukprot:XP_001302826.1 hypothetical protein [Trichomonas vaginalis G3]